MLCNVCLNKRDIQKKKYDIVFFFSFSFSGNGNLETLRLNRLNPLIYTMYHPDFIICSFMEITIGLKRVKRWKADNSSNNPTNTIQAPIVDITRIIHIFTMCSPDRFMKATTYNYVHETKSQLPLNTSLCQVESTFGFLGCPLPHD